MRYYFLVFGVGFFLLAGCNSSPKNQQNPSGIPIIFETDMSTDVDDVGALAILHALEGDGKVNILAVCFNEVHKDGAAAIDAINTWYGRGNIPIGVYKGKLVDPHSSKYLTDLATTFPNDIPKVASRIPDALDVYINTLSGQPDQSVVIISVGFLNNLADLLVNHKELVAKKVKKLVLMGGKSADDRTWNISQHNLMSVSEKVYREWPTPIVITELGTKVYTGACLEDASWDNPVKMAWYRWFDNKFEGRSSWDEIAVLYTVYGTDLFNEEWNGSGYWSNGYSYSMKEGLRSYITPKLSNSEYQTIIDELMMK